jgi:iron complex transport system permease protein
MIKTKFNMLMGLIVLAIVSIFFSIAKGSTSISFLDLIHSITSQQNALIYQIIVELRIPRTLSAFVTGGLLAMSGVIMQILLRNPLADPYILGISGGAAVASLLCLFFGLAGYWLTGAAWLGSLCVMVIILALSKKNHSWDTEKVLLTGVALTSGFSALISFILMISDDRELHSMLFWLLGDLSYAHKPYMESAILLIALLLSLSLAKQLNVLSRGNREAESLGIELSTLHKQLYLLSSLLTATAVALAGCIGFIGLIVPHVLRLIGGYDHRWLIPSSVLLGGSLLTLADTFSRYLFAPQQLPVGIMMALLGIPIFLWLLHKKSFI